MINSLSTCFAGIMAKSKQFEQETRKRKQVAEKQGTCRDKKALAMTSSGKSQEDQFLTCRDKEPLVQQLEENPDIHLLTCRHKRPLAATTRGKSGHPLIEATRNHLSRQPENFKGPLVTTTTHLRRQAAQA